MSDRDEYLAYAKKQGLTVDAALVLADLTSLAASRANESIAIVARTAPSKELALMIQLNAAVLLYTSTRSALAEVPVIGAAIVAEIDAKLAEHLK